MIAGPRNEAAASSLLIIGPNLVGAALGPLAFRMISNQLAPMLGVDALRWALVFVPIVAAFAGGALMIANTHKFRALHGR